jgi:hypothetical protein
VVDDHCLPHYTVLILYKVDPSESSRFIDVQPGGFSIQYLETSITGDWITDNFGGSIIQAQPMSLVTNTMINNGIMDVIPRRNTP